jgi:mRNA-degrading endonuclease RelE of RelBE toxin-antitoxin system
MNYNVLTIPPFEKQLKRLARKYPSLKAEFASLVDQLEIAPDQGTTLGNNCYKIRLSIASKQKGKSGGARVITNFAIADSTVYLLSIYDKGERETLSDSELKELLKFVQD